MTSMTLDSSPAAMAAVKLVHYLYAPALALSYLSALTYSKRTLQQPVRHDTNFRKRELAQIIMLLVIVNYISQAIFYLYPAITKETRPPQHTIVHMMGSILTWSSLSLVLSKTKAPMWHPYFGAWVVGFLFEFTLCLIAISSLSVDKQHGIQLAFQALKTICTAVLVVNGYFLAFRIRMNYRSDEERQPLLDNEASSADSENADGGIKKQRRKTLEELDWIASIRSFSIFLPYLWPRKTFRMQLYLAVIVFDLIANRFLSVLTPREFGIIASKLATVKEKLTANVGNGKLPVHHSVGMLPWRDILTWIVFVWLQSSAGLALIKEFALTVLQLDSSERIYRHSFEHVMNLDMAFHADKDSQGVIMSIQQADSLNDLLEEVFFQLAPAVVDLIVAVWYLTYLFDIGIALVVLMVGILYAWTGIIITTWTSPHRKAQVEKRRSRVQILSEAISNYQTVKYFSRTEYEQERFMKAVKESFAAYLTLYSRVLFGNGVQSLLQTLGFFGCLLLAAWKIIVEDGPVGHFVTFVVYWQNLMAPLQNISQSYRRLATMYTNVEWIRNIWMTKSSVLDPENPSELKVGDGRVELHDVDFAYRSGKSVIKQMDFTAQPGQTIALVGASGGGKSTIAKLLYRFYDVDAGSITIDGQDLRAVTQKDLRNALGIVPQETGLFNASIRHNLQYAKEDATNEDLENACKAAAIHDKIESFQDGYDTVIGENGVKLSGGEKQRIGIARLLLQNPKIILLDEATSALDNETEEDIQEAFANLTEGKTTIKIAHRMSTIQNADLIAVVEDGKISESGTHEELLQRGGTYARLYGKDGKDKKDNKGTVL